MFKKKLQAREDLSPAKVEAVLVVLKAVGMHVGMGGAFGEDELSKVATALGIDLSDFVDDLV